MQQRYFTNPIEKIKRMQIEQKYRKIFDETNPFDFEEERMQT
ncbi:MAG: hypothetical protein ACMXYA_03750 [Candidatus Woesearchaeota archaeon]